VNIHLRRGNDLEASSVSVDESVDLRDRQDVVAVGDRLLWRDQTVEITDIARLSAEWTQVVVRFVARPSQPFTSMPYEDLVAGLRR
jgi:hypothetical protein